MTITCISQSSSWDLMFLLHFSETFNCFNTKSISCCRINLYLFFNVNFLNKIFEQIHFFMSNIRNYLKIWTSANSTTHGFKTLTYRSNLSRFIVFFWIEISLKYTLGGFDKVQLNQEDWKLTLDQWWLSMNSV